MAFYKTRFVVIVAARRWNAVEQSSLRGKSSKVAETVRLRRGRFAQNKEIIKNNEAVGERLLGFIQWHRL